MMMRDPPPAASIAKPILIVEDELAIADSIAYALRTDGFIARHVSLGSLALTACAPRTQRRRP